MIILTKKFDFEAAHRLGNGYCGKCASNHGHSWKGHVKVTRRTDTLDEFGMAIDYADIKEVIKPLIDALDHSTIVSEKDETMLRFLIEENQKLFVVPGNPTSEILAQVMLNTWKPLFKERDCVLCEVVLEETCTTSCIAK